MKYTIYLLVLFTVLAQSAVSQPVQNLTGHWEGHIAIQGSKLIINTHIQKQDDGKYSGTIDIPQQGASGLPLQKISTSEDSVFFEFPAGPGLAEFRGVFGDGSAISGTFHQRGMQFPFELKRVQPDTEAVKDERPLPYNHKEMVIKNDTISIAGTLTWPENKTDQLVILISGSGAQNRDEEIMGFKPFFQIADYLTRNGIASFRFDDRGIGKSTGNFGNATLDVLASDVEAVISELTTSPDHTFTEITLLGHSQGGVIAAKIAAENKAVDKLILMASTGVSLKEVLRFQVRQAFEQASISDSLIETEISARENLMQAIADNENIEQAKGQYREQFETIQLAAGMDSTKASAVARQQVQQLTSAFGSPQMQSLLFHDPATDLKNLNIPVLVLFGRKDTQVTTEMNKSPIKKALEKAGVEYQLEVFENANHLFQKAKTGTASEYGSLDKEFVNGFLSTIKKWIEK